MARESFSIRGNDFQVPRDLPTSGRSSGVAASFEKGVRAAARGTKAESCPYKPRRGSAKFRKAWLRGWSAYHKAMNTDNQTRRVAS